MSFQIFMLSILLTVFFSEAAFARGRNFGTTSEGKVIVSEHQESSVFVESQKELIAVLRPHVVSLDRDLVVFRYEAKDPQRFNPKVQQDLINRAYPWSKRFFNPDIVRNPDGGGPGLYTSTDPTATATWGFSAPGLFTMTIKQKSNILLGDANSASEAEATALKKIFANMNCGTPYNGRTFDNAEFDQVIVLLRNAENPECRRMVIGAFEKMQIVAITYGFYSTPLENCRATGTAINIVWPDAIRLNEINYYSDDIVIEGDKSLTPHVQALFEEGKDFYFTKSVMANETLLAQYKNAFGYFHKRKTADPVSQRRWKQNHILTCGKPWPTERPNFRASFGLIAKRYADLELQDLMAQTTIAYNQRKFFSSDLEAPGAANSFDLPSTRRIVEMVNRNFPSQNFQEPNGYSEWNRKILFGLDRISHQQRVGPAAMYFALRAAGFPEANAVRTFNLFQTTVGATIMLEGSLSKDVRQLSLTLKHNRQLVMESLRQCLKIYKDTEISKKEILDGPCGITQKD
jgi:hypothetical protein